MSIFKAGDRMPYFLVEGQSIYDKLHQPFHWLIFSNPLSDVQALKTELDHSDLEFVDFNVIPLTHRWQKSSMNQVFNILSQTRQLHCVHFSRSLAGTGKTLSQATDHAVSDTLRSIAFVQ